MGFLSGIGSTFGSIHYVAPTGMINFTLTNGSILSVTSVGAGADSVWQLGPWVIDGIPGPGAGNPLAAVFRLKEFASDPHDIKFYHDDTAAVATPLTQLDRYQEALAEHNPSGSFNVFVYGAGGNDILTTGTTKDWVYGGNDNDTISTGANADFLFGGLGRDILTGGAGNDNFVFNTTLGASSVDTITDFNNGNDTIRLENAIFRTIGATGVLNADAFLSNTTGLPADAEDRIIYERDTGELYYDADGSGAGGQVLFAVLDAGLTLSAADFFVI